MTIRGHSVLQKQSRNAAHTNAIPHRVEMNAQRWITAREALRPVMDDKRWILSGDGLRYNMDHYQFWMDDR